MRQQDFVCICSCFLQHQVRETTSNMLYPSAQVYLTQSEVFTYLLFSGHLFVLLRDKPENKQAAEKKLCTLLLCTKTILAKYIVKIMDTNHLNDHFLFHYTSYPE